MSRMPGATWKPLAADWTDQPRMRAHDIVCIHTMVGGLDGTDSLFRAVNGPGYDGTESHFGTGGDGRIVQWQDILFQADANYLGNGTVISIENADHGPEFPSWGGSDVPPLTDEQIEANAEILAWVCSPAAHVDCPPSWVCHREGIPLELIPDALPGRRGVAPHRWGVPGYMAAGAVQWSTARGKACPGDRRIAQIPQIIARAKQLMAGSAAPQEDEMQYRFITASPTSPWFAWDGRERFLVDRTMAQALIDCGLAYKDVKVIPPAVFAQIPRPTASSTPSAAEIAAEIVAKLPAPSGGSLSITAEQIAEAVVDLEAARLSA